MGGCHSSDFPAASSEVHYRTEINLNQLGSETNCMGQNSLRDRKKEQMSWILLWAGQRGGGYSGSCNPAHQQVWTESKIKRGMQCFDLISGMTPVGYSPHPNHCISNGYCGTKGWRGKGEKQSKEH